MRRRVPPELTTDEAALTRNQKKALLHFMRHWMGPLLRTPMAYHDLKKKIPGVAPDDALDFFNSDEIGLK